MLIRGCLRLLSGHICWRNSTSISKSVSQEGIFRITGSVTRKNELREKLFQGRPLDLVTGGYSVHDCASVLKSFLADLSEPLLSKAHFPIYHRIGKIWSDFNSVFDESRLLYALRLLLLLLPLTNRILLKNLLTLLNKTARFEGENKMNYDSLATIFTPHLMCPSELAPEDLLIHLPNLQKIVSFMIKHINKLYNIPKTLEADVRLYWSHREKILMSPRKKTNDVIRLKEKISSSEANDDVNKLSSDGSTGVVIRRRNHHENHGVEKSRKHRSEPINFCSPSKKSGDSTNERRKSTPLNNKKKIIFNFFKLEKNKSKRNDCPVSSSSSSAPVTENEFLNNNEGEFNNDILTANPVDLSIFDQPEIPSDGSLNHGDFNDKTFIIATESENFENNLLELLKNKNNKFSSRMNREILKKKNNAEKRKFIRII